MNIPLVISFNRYVLSHWHFLIEFKPIQIQLKILSFCENECVLGKGVCICNLRGGCAVIGWDGALGRPSSAPWRGQHTIHTRPNIPAPVRVPNKISFCEEAAKCVRDFPPRETKCGALLTHRRHFCYCCC